MSVTTQKEKINLSHAKAIRRSRELLKVSRADLAARLKVSVKAVQKYESGRAIIHDEKLNKILEALDLVRSEYEKVRRGKSLLKGHKVRKVHSNYDRRSYQRIITKEVRVLRVLRKRRGISQDQASALCGYSRPSIGHIENGRIELDDFRVCHIISSYGFEMREFEVLMKEEVLRDEILEGIIKKIISLPEDKILLIHSLVSSF